MKRSERALAKAQQVVDAGPAPLFRAALASFALTATLTLVIAVVVRPAGAFPRSQQVLIGVALSALCVLGAIGVGSLWWRGESRTRVLDRIAPPTTRAATWLALAVWFPLMLIPIYLSARSDEPSSTPWLPFPLGHMDKRWETSTYFLGTLAPMLLLVGATRVLEVGSAHPETWGSWLRQTAGGEQPNDSGATDRRRVALRVTLCIATAILLAYYFYGPPWNLSSNPTRLDYHEDLHFSGYQAISKGYVPYVSAAANQYGPGAQVLSYLYMRHVATFSVIGARESWSAFHWVGASVFFVTLFLTLGYLRAFVAAIAAALIYPSLQLYGFAPNSTWSGFFGWANLLRYVGAFALLMLLPGVVRRCHGRVGLVAGIGLGFVWGASTYVAQENLLAGAIGAIAIGLLLLLSGTNTGREVRTALLSVLVGASLVWIPVLGYYAYEGVLRRFLHLYFLFPLAVAQGYTNTPYAEGLHSAWGRMYYAFPFVLAGLAVLSVVSFRPFRITLRWGHERTLLVTTLATTTVLYEGALLRSDSTHLAATILAVPALVVVVATTLPRALGARRQATVWSMGFALVVLAAVLVPRTALEWPGVKARLEAPYLDRRRVASERSPARPSSLAAGRIGAGLDTAPICCTGSTWSMPQFIDLMNRVHSIVGDRTAYVVDFPAAYPGLIYFVADLNPAPSPLDPYTMVVTLPQSASYYKDIQENVLPRTGAVLTSSLDKPEAQAFAAAYPKARRVTLAFDGQPYYILLR